MRNRDRDALAARYDRESRDAREHAVALRALLETVEALHAGDVEAGAVEQG